MLSRRGFLKTMGVLALPLHGCGLKKTKKRSDATPLPEVKKKVEGGKTRFLEDEGSYIIAEPCVDVRDKACVDVCPVDCIYEVEETQLEKEDKAYKSMLYINPEECIYCGACEPECPVEAIFPESEVPDKWKEYIKYNYIAFGIER